MYRQESTWFYEGAYNYNIGKYEKSKQTQLLSVGLWKANVLQSVLNVSTDVIGLNSAEAYSKERDNRTCSLEQVTPYLALIVQTVKNTSVDLKGLIGSTLNKPLGGKAWAWTNITRKFCS